jgi:diguanylate cyclase (GGDEF)-like protein/PAS domain S-box-containing protein
VLGRRALQATSDRHTIVVDLTTALRKLDTPDDVMRATAETIGRHLCAQRAGFAEKTEGNMLRHTIAWTDGSLDPVSVDLPEVAIGTGLSEVANKGRTIAISDVEHDPLTADSLLPSLGVHSCIAVPIVRHGRWHAGFYVHCSETRVWATNEIACVEEIAALAWDAVERARARSDLAESETRFRTALEIAELGTFDWDRRTGHVIYSERTKEIFGFSGDEGDHAENYFARMLPEDRVVIENVIAGTTAREPHMQVDYRIRRPDDSIRYVTSIGEGFCSPEGECLRILGVVSDTSRRKLAEQALRENAEVFNATFEHAGIGITHIDRSGHFRLANRKFCEMVGYTREELYQMTFAELTHPDDREIGAKEFQQTMRGEGHSLTAEKRYVCKDGSIIWARINATSITDESGVTKYNVAVIEDITERKENEEHQLFMLRLDACLRELYDPAEIPRAVCRLLGERLEANYVYFAEFEEDEDHLVIRADYRNGLRQFNGYWRLRDFGGAIAPMLRSGGTMVINDVRKDEHAANLPLSLFDAIDARSGVAVPLLRQGHLRSMFAVLGSEPRVWPETAVRLIEETAARAREAVERGRAEHELRVTNERLSLAVAGTGDAVWDWYINDGRVEFSPRMAEILGYPEHEMPKYSDTWLKMVHPDDVERLEEAANDCVQGRTRTFACEYRIHCHNGSYRWLLSRGIVVARDARKRPIRMAGMITDISERKEADERIWHHANFDALTGMPNRRLFRDRLNRDVVNAGRNRSKLALMFIDLDRFKQVNDLLGHDAGDLLLKEAARRIADCVRESDTVARIGGDEFTVILSKLGHTEHVEHLAQKLLDALHQPFKLNKESAYVSGSIGVAIFPDDGYTSEELIRKADQAMYAAKHAGKNQFSYFTRSMDESAHLRLRLANELRKAMPRGQLEVHYQPVIDFRSGEIVKAEALLRWRHPSLGPVEPSQFIPLAEESGMITDIGNWVFREAAQCSRRWSASLDAPFQIAVNKSPVQFLSHAEENWLEYLERMELPGNAISVEITEGLLLHAANNVADTLLRYRDAGIQVAIDDFGTGYSSMSYLKKFDIDYLKIDQSFVRDITTDLTNQTIAESIIVMAHKLGLKVIAEGIETAEQRDLLVAAGCDYGQGFLFSRAVPADEFERLLAGGPHEYHAAVHHGLARQH